MRRALVSACAAITLAISGSAQQYGLRTYSVEHGLPSSAVFAMAEDADGYLWIGTAQGAARTNGLRFEHIGRKQGLPHDAVTALAADDSGSVWLGFANGAVARGVDGRITVMHAGPSATVKAIAVRGDEVWCATSGQGILRLHPGGEERHGRNHGLRSEQVNALCVDQHERLIAGTDSGLFLLSEARWQAVAVGGLPHLRVQALHGDAQGLLVGTANGFAELDASLAPPARPRKPA